MTYWRFERRRTADLPAQVPAREAHVCAPERDAHSSSVLPGSPFQEVRGRCSKSGGWLTGRQSSDTVSSADHDGVVPRISVFYGIVITMYFYDHDPPLSMLSTPSIMR